MFRRPLEDGQQWFGPSETNSFVYHDDGRPRVVKYRGEWYHVRVVIV